MKEMTKFVFILMGLVGFAVIAQIKIGNQGSWIIWGVALFSIGFGWYAKSAKEEGMREISK